MRQLCKDYQILHHMPVRPWLVQVSRCCSFWVWHYTHRDTQFWRQYKTFGFWLGLQFPVMPIMMADNHIRCECNPLLFKILLPHPLKSTVSWENFEAESKFFNVTKICGMDEFFFLYVCAILSGFTRQWWSFLSNLNRKLYYYSVKGI